MVGTTWVWVTRSRSITARKRSGSNLSMITTVPPSSWVPADQKSPAEW